MFDMNVSDIFRRAYYKQDKKICYAQLCGESRKLNYTGGIVVP